MNSERLIIEEADLRAKLDKLENFMCTERFDDLPVEMKMLMAKQQQAMKNYQDALVARIKLVS